MRKPAQFSVAKGRQAGAATVEFAMVAVLFLTLLLSIMDFGRMLFTWNAAAEATRWGARIAVVCDKADAAQVRARMKAIVPQLTDANIVIEWQNPEGVPNASCTQGTCKGVKVSIYNNSANPDDPGNFRIAALSPFMGFVMPPVPAFATYLPRESMQTTSDAGDANPICL